MIIKKKILKKWLKGFAEIYIAFLYLSFSFNVKFLPKTDRGESILWTTKGWVLKKGIF